MYFTHRHFYVRELPYRVDDRCWGVFEDNSFWSVYVTTKYRAQFIRDYMLKWLCNHHYFRLHAFIHFLETLHYVTSDWQLIREQILVIDKSPRMAF